MNPTDQLAKINLQVVTNRINNVEVPKKTDDPQEAKIINTDNFDTTDDFLMALPQ